MYMNMPVLLKSYALSSSSMSLCRDMRMFFGQTDPSAVAVAVAVAHAHAYMNVHTRMHTKTMSTSRVVVGVAVL